MGFYDEDDDDNELSQFQTPQALREWAKQQAKENKALKSRLEKVLTEQRTAQVDTLFAEFDPRVKTWVPKDVDPAQWLEANKEILPKAAPVASDQNAEVQQNQAPEPQQSPVSPQAQQGFAAAEAGIGQDTAGGTASTSPNTAAFGDALNKGGLDGLVQLLQSEGVQTGRVV